MQQQNDLPDPLTTQTASTTREKHGGHGGAADSRAGRAAAICSPAVEVTAFAAVCAREHSARIRLGVGQGGGLVAHRRGRRRLLAAEQPEQDDQRNTSRVTPLTPTVTKAQHRDGHIRQDGMKS